uniref:Glycine cleavage system P protein n=1 Tax=Spongospora subterranea TaxID=70186 RepID=A0A0H5QTD2_9EUKA|eukprot:CRZ05195.1 hypothetical protein [Spongospora subterranea]
MHRRFVRASIVQFHAGLCGGRGSQWRCMTVFQTHDSFLRRHIGSNEGDVEEMLKVVGVQSLSELTSQCVPQGIISKKPLKLPPAAGESDAISELKNIMKENRILRSHIGAGYYGTITPPVILRNILENPSWYTPYTPYQAEIAQGRLEMLLNYQTMVSDLTGLPVSNASLLDEGTAAAEAAVLAFNSSTNKKADTFFVSSKVHPQTIAVIRTRAEPLGLKIVVSESSSWKDFDNVCGVMVQYPDTTGILSDYEELCDKVHNAGGLVVAAADLLSLTLIKPPGEWGADVAVGNSQRFGVPLGYGGPHAAFFACKDELKRRAPGRIIGVSRDCNGRPALRMALQTREQHIRREKATSNICTAQALLANIAAAYAIYHGPEGLKAIAKKVLRATQVLRAGLVQLGVKCLGSERNSFDTVTFKGNAKSFATAGIRHGFNIRIISEEQVSISLDETVKAEQVQSILQAVSEAWKLNKPEDVSNILAKLNSAGADAVGLLSPKFIRQSQFLTHPVFNSHSSETQMLRYLQHLSNKDLSLANAMIPLGSCTMKLNATSEMIPITWPEVSNLHPFVPSNQAKGYKTVLSNLREYLSEITGFSDVSLQPNSGAQGEYAGLLCIRAYQKSIGNENRDVCLIPTSAHGTNPASAVLAGFKVVTVNCDKKGNISMSDLQEKVEANRDRLACIMVTYPSTHGVFEDTIKETCKIIHDNGGQVYMDGANMNAQVGLTKPGEIGADVCHLNLHKTFCIPHGGGGPGMGPIGVAAHLAPFLPGHCAVPDVGGEKAISAVSAAPYASASILPISWMYIRMMGPDGLKNATEMAILHANYMASRLSGAYDILYTGGQHNRVAHEFIIDLNPFKKYGIVEEDVAKRLMDYSFHGPTMSWPVVGTLMIEPTESEPKEEMDRFCDAMLAIRDEIEQVITGKVAPEDSVLKGAPHSMEMLLSDKWEKKYSREDAAYPVPSLRNRKFWSTVGRIDNVYGDRNVICQCPPLESYNN